MSLLPTIGAIDQTGFYNGVATQSLRFDIASTSYLKRQPSASNRKTYVLSFWLKPSKDTLNSAFLVARTGSGGTYTNLCFSASNNTIRVVDNQGSYPALQTSGQYRDVSAWYHIVFAVDTTQTTDSNKLKVYVNGTEQSYGTSYYYTTNDNTNINSTDDHYIGYNAGVANLDGYLAEYNFIDGLSFFSDTSGTANTSFNINSFGETKNGVWIAKDYSGSYGTNGYRLAFNSTDFNTSGSSTMTDPHGSGTAVPVNGLADASGQGNHWTTNGIGAVDFVSDSPENNFATFNAIYNLTGGSLSEGTLKVATGSSQYGPALSTFAQSSGKWYAEFAFTSTSGDTRIGGVRVDTALSTTYDIGNSGSFAYRQNDGDKKIDGTETSYGATWSASDIIGIALNLDDNEVTFYKNNASQGTFSITGGEYFIALSDGDSGAGGNYLVNFGQDSSFAGNKTSGSANAKDANGIGDFYYAPPSGFLALCTSNLPEPTIGPNSGTDEQADDYFNTVLWSGNNSTQSITGVGFKPDWLWIKNRSSASFGHSLTDSSRGANEVLSSDSTDDEFTNANNVNAFTSDGFNLGNTSFSGYSNQTGSTYVGWNWKANGGTTTTNDASSTGVGTIDSVYQANTTSGFSIVTWTNTSSNNQTIAHGLGVAPTFIIAKSRSTNSSAWVIGHSASSFNWTNDYYQFDNGQRRTDGGDTVFGGTPDQNVFTFGTAAGGNGVTFVAYCFAEIEGYSKFGSYEGNGATDGTFVYTGFRPAWILYKNADSSGDWELTDTVRNPVNDGTLVKLEPNNAGTDSNRVMDILSNGFKFRNSSNSNTAHTYIYMAFAEAPFKYANAR